MSSTSDAFSTSVVTAHSKSATGKYSFSRKRWSPFEAWQEHVRKSAAQIDRAFSTHPDRDLRRAIVAG
jgi:hypothetical protein